MTQTIPTVQKYMTPSPHTVDAEQTMSDAHSLLYQKRVRHLPVMRGQQLVGMLYERDFALIAALGSVDLSSVKVKDAMSLSIYKVSPDAPLEQVAHEMASKRLDSVIVVHDGTVAGILTTVDVCSALAASLHNESRNTKDDA
jgi:acetoin utilization protein AcuB